jgi:hypothetical protein
MRWKIKAQKRPCRIPPGVLHALISMDRFRVLYYSLRQLLFLTHSQLLSPSLLLLLLSMLLVIVFVVGTAVTVVDVKKKV